MRNWKFSRGPWKVDLSMIRGAGGEEIAVVKRLPRSRDKMGWPVWADSPRRYNARLIAVSTEMIELLADIADAGPEMTELDIREYCGRARQIIRHVES